MSRRYDRATWQLPIGVAAGTWDYARSRQIASSYDEFHQSHRLFELDQRVVRRYLAKGDRLVDLGCGTGRAILPLLNLDVQVTAVDLSQAMLEILGQKVRDSSRRNDSPAEAKVACIRANLVELDCLARDSFDLALCLFSTLGMIRTCDARHLAMKHFARILKPGGHLILQVHNYWSQILTVAGRADLVRNAAKRLRNREVERGDKTYPYRGLPNMFLHLFTMGEICKLFRSSGLEVVETISLNASQQHEVKNRWFFGSARTGGWILVLRKP